VVPELLSNLGGRFTVLAFFLFGIGALTYARHPEGAVEFNKRRSLVWLSTWLDRRAGREPTTAVLDQRTLAEADAPALGLTADGQTQPDGAAPSVPERSHQPGGS
jgi:hypothetical protein